MSLSPLQLSTYLVVTIVIATMIDVDVDVDGFCVLFNTFNSIRAIEWCCVCWRDNSDNRNIIFGDLERDSFAFVVQLDLRFVDVRCFM